ncbi:MAG: DUF4133 domain-containing protein [Rikenellaceae bacterium]
MANYQINKGIGKSVELSGLTMRYILLLAGGLVGVFLLFVILSLAGLHTTTNLVITLAAAVTLTWQIFAHNKKYGEYGAMKRQARSYRPRYIIRRKSTHKLFKHNAKHI